MLSVVFLIVMLSFDMLTVIMLSVIMLSVVFLIVMLSFDMLTVIILSIAFFIVFIVIRNVAMLSIVAPNS